MLWERPWLLLLLLALPVLFWATARARAPLGRGRRVLLALLQGTAWTALVVALAGPWQRAPQPVHRIAVVAPGADAGAVQAWREATPFAEPFRVVTADLQPRSGALGDATVPSGPTEPDLGAALATAASWLPAGARADIAVFGAAGDVGDRLEAQGAALLAGRDTGLADGTDPQPERAVRLHWRGAPLAAPAPRLLRVDHAARRPVGAPFPVECRVAAGAPMAARLEVRRDAADGDLLGSAEVMLRAGESTHLVEVRGTARAGLLRLYTAVLVADAAAGADPDRQIERSAVLLEGRTRVLALSDASRAAALTSTLAPHGFQIDFVGGREALAKSTLDAADVVVVDDVPAGGWSQDDQQAVRDAILQGGAGFLLAGREANLGPGGYADSPLADVLPVETPQREERRDPSVALVMIVDTSGSMGNRIELAKEVARLAIRRLMPHDKAGIVEFYGSKRWAAPLQPASNVIELLRALNRLQAGGGTVIYSAIEESYYALLNVRTRFKHVLVLTDGGVESGPFEALARRMAASGITLNTVLIGPQANSPFLLDLAQWGRGRFYACPSRFQLPDLRFKEPQTTLLPAVREGSFPVVRPVPSEATRGLSLDDARVGGLVDARPRPFAEVLLETADGGGRPLLAAWDQGAGRSAVLATDLLGAATAELHDQGWSNLLADLLRSLAAGKTALQRGALEVDCARDALRVAIDDPSGAVGPHPTVRLLDADGTLLLAVTALADHRGRFVAELPWPENAGALRVEVDGLPAVGAARPLSRAKRPRDVSRTLSTLAADSGGSVAGALPIDGPERPRAAGQDDTVRQPALPWLARLGLLAFLGALLARRWPARRSVARIAPAAALLLTVLATGGQISAQQPDGSPQERIQQELREKGHLDALREAWQDAPVADRALLLMSDGDLTGLRDLLAAEGGDDLAALQALALDATGDLTGALAAAERAAQDESLPDAERAAWLLRCAELRLAVAGKTGAGRNITDQSLRDDAATNDLRAAVAADGRPEFAFAVGHLAGSLGLFELARDLHRIDAGDAPQTPDVGRSQAAMRRAQWAESQGEIEAALTEWNNAAGLATLDRERGFALSRLLDLARRHDRLAPLIDDWVARFAELDPVTRGALLDALRELDRGAEALDLLERPEVRDDDELQSQALALAVSAGDPERALRAALTQLATDPRQSGLRVATALLLTDLRRRDEARAILTAGFEGASRRELLRLAEAAAELGDAPAFQAGLEALRARGTPRDRLDALLLEVATLRGRLQRDAAADLLLAARAEFTEPAQKVRLGEALESLGRVSAAVELYRAAFEATGTEDLAFRLGWLLAASKDDAEREESAELFRTVWLEAGSRARRVQAEERVLDLAAREGKLADLVLELEAALAAPETTNRTAKREALVKIWSRAQDTFGAREVLLDWARAEPEKEIEAWQRLAQVQLENQEFLAYDRTVRHLLELDPEREIDYRQQLALGFLERGRPGDARAVIREMLDGGRADAVAFEFSAGILSLAGRHEGAAKLYRQALATHPDRIETLLLWANSMAAMGQKQRAAGRFLTILFDETIRDDLFLVAIDGLLNLEADRPALAFATRALRRRLATRPNKVYLYRGLQDLYEALGEEDARVASLDQTLVVAGLQRTAWLRELMDEASRRRNTEGYLGHARALLRSGEEVPPAVFLEIGEVRLAAGDLTGAERAFERARLAPDFAAVERRVAELYVDNDKLGDAERVRRRILRRDPGNPTALLAVAEVVELRGRREEALGAYRDATMLLLDGIDVDAETGGKDKARRNNRNQSDSGPSWQEAFEGALRCADVATDLTLLRTRLAELAGSEPAEGAELSSRMELVDRLAGLALAFAEDPSAEDGLWAEVARLEDALLGAESADDALRRRVFDSRLARGDLDGAGAVVDLLEDEPKQLATRKLAMLAGRPEDAIPVLTELPPAKLLEPIRELVAIGRRDLAQPLYDRVLAAAEPPQDVEEGAEPVAPDQAAVRILSRVRGLLGIVHDDNAERAERLEKALNDDSGALRARVSRRTAALRGLDEDESDSRDALLRSLAQLLPQIIADRDDDAAWTLISSCKDDFDKEQLAPLVAILMEGVDRIYTFPSRAAHLDLLPLDEAVELSEKTLDRFEKAEVQSLLLRMLALNEMPKSVQAALIADLRLTELQPSDQSWLSRIASGEAELDESAATALLVILRRDRASEPSTALFAARIAPEGSDERRTEARRAADAVRGDDAPDYNVIKILDAVADLADETLADELLAEPRDATADLLLRAQLLLGRGDNATAADLLTLACGRSPDNLSLLNRAKPVLLDAGRREAAIELYLAWAAQSAKIYIYQAAQVADMLLDAGRPMEAVQLLERADDPAGTGLQTRLKAIAAIDDPAERAPRARAWLLDRQASARKRQGMMYFSTVGNNSSERFTPADVLGAVELKPLAPQTAADADSEGDMLAFLPEGGELAEAVLRATPATERDRLPGLYRGLIGAARLRGETDDLMAGARARLAARPGDAEALRMLLAAAQLGIEVDPEELRRALERRTLATGAEVELLVDAVQTAAGSDLAPLRDGLLDVALADRNSLGNYRLREKLQGLMLIAKGSRAERLLQLAPGRQGINAWLDGDLLSGIALAAGIDPAAAQTAFAGVGEIAAADGQQHWHSRVALPYAGVCLRAGDATAAVSVLGVRDPQLQYGDRFPALALAATVPPLELWTEPVHTPAEFADALIGRFADNPSAGHRAVWFRCLALLALRLEAAERDVEAIALRERLRPLAVGLAGADEWLLPSAAHAPR